MLKGFIAGLAVANAFEWFAHKYILHGVHRPGQPRYSPVPKSMESHWAHHREVRKQEFSDDCYVEGVEHWRTRNDVIGCRGRCCKCGILSNLKRDVFGGTV